MKIIFFGSPIYTIRIIDQIKSSKNELLAIVTQNEKKGKRGKIQKTPVEIYAKENLIKFFTPEKINDKKFITDIKQQNPDLFIIFAYGKILPLELINIPKHGCLNIHASLLPKWRGAAPIQRCILNRDKKTGITFFKIDEELDKGDIIASHELEILDDDNNLTLQSKLSKLASDYLEDSLKKIVTNANFIKQNESESSYAKKILKNESKIEWTDSADNIVLKIKAFSGWPVVEAKILGESLKIWSAEAVEVEDKCAAGKIVNLDKNGLSVSTSKGILCIKKLQFPGKKIITARDLCNSNSGFATKIKDKIKHKMV